MSPIKNILTNYQALSKAAITAAISAYPLFISNHHLLCLWEYLKFLKKTYEISSQPLLTGINCYVITETRTQNSASTAQYFNQLNHDHHVAYIYGSDRNRTCKTPSSGNRLFSRQLNSTNVQHFHKILAQTRRLELRKHGLRPCALPVKLSLDMADVGVEPTIMEVMSLIY